MKNEYTVHIVIKKYLFVYLIKAWTIDKNNTLNCILKNTVLNIKLIKLKRICANLISIEIMK